MKKKFKINQFVFSLVLPEDLPMPENFLKFEVADDSENCETENYRYQIDFADTFPEPEGTALLLRDNLQVYNKEGLERRYIGTEGYDITYGYYEEISSDSAHVLVKEEYKAQFVSNTMFTSLLALEKRELDYNSILLHTSYIEYMGEAILFSAPSETGKTTQSNLWEKYRGAKTINGDRSFLFKKEGIWHAGGCPVCGTSEICNNIELPIKAIVMLSQAQDNQVERLAPMKAFSQVYSQITINRWNPEAHNKAMNLIEQLITEVPVYHLACNISEDAVVTLERKLYIER